MKLTLSYFFLILPIFVQAKLIEVPEGCISEKNVPCLVQVQVEEEQVVLEDFKIRIYPNSIVKWTSFESDEEEQKKIAFDLLKGQIFFEIKEPILVNSIEFKNRVGMIQKTSDFLDSFDIKTFNLTTYKMDEKNKPEKIIKSRFLDKNEFVHFTAQFFKSTKSLKQFLTALEPYWKKQFETQAEIQTKVLSRSVASVEDEKKRNEEEIKQRQKQFKKVRDEFFYRTFYR